MGILLTAKDIEQIAMDKGDTSWLPKKYLDHYLKAQLKKVAEWGEEPCPHHQLTSAKRCDCCICTMDIWQVLLKEIVCLPTCLYFCRRWGHKKE